MKQLTIIEQQDNNQFSLYDNRLDTILREFAGFEFADVRESIDDVAGQYGSVYITSKNGKRQMSIKGDLVSSDPFAQRRLLQKALRQTGTIKLIKFTTYDDLQLQCEAEVTKFLAPYTHQIHEFLIEMIAPDWRFYSQELQSHDIAQTIVRGGMSIPANVPFSLPSPMVSDTEVSNILTNIGNETSDPIITITGPGAGFTIGNTTDDKEFFLDATLVGGDTVVIDVKKRTVVKNDVTNLYSSISGDFWSILPGENELRFLVSSGLTTDTNLNIQFRHAYAGI